MKKIKKIILNNEEYQIGGNADVDLSEYMKKKEWEVFEEIYDEINEDVSKRLHKLEKAPAEITITLPDESTEINNLTDEQRATIYEAITNKRQLVVKFNNTDANEYYVVYDFKGYNPEMGSNAWSETLSLWQSNKYYTIIIYNATETGWMRVQVNELGGSSETPDIDLSDYATKDEINKPQFELLSENTEIPSKENVIFFIYEDTDADRTTMYIFLDCPNSSNYIGVIVNETTGQSFGEEPYCKGTYEVLAKEGDVIKVGDYDYITEGVSDTAVVLEYQPENKLTTVTITGFGATPVVTVTDRVTEGE